ncbi:MAG: dUTP diphosphatase [Fulvimarina manganoxydans]|uniref:dUTP diphosphatase n=1 Tax=Fulvimarina manganoxydans TaxID=937218 RepID=UPI0023542FFD|nr:dUTP diphosphatase [Fulvimarina manganoxydans]MCK5930898.1 dUTP diphosphatase [Fulvimarina manganoxydans]
MSEIRVAVQRLPHGEGLPLPRYETDGAAGADLRAAIDTDLVLQPGARALVPSGLRFAIPDGYEMQVRPRSGLAARQGVTVLNTPGTVDSDYRGEVMVILINLGDQPVTIARGDRIAQIVLSPVTRGTFFEGAALDETLRGGGGFGSSGR